MDESILGWPAFQEASHSGEIGYELGVWGKAPGAHTDFRWIARSGGSEHDGELAGQISLGTEDQPVKTQLWRRHGGRYYAAGLYPSRARDASGRTDFLEKQVLAWTQSDDATPAALGALLLLPKVASLNADVWWSRIGDPAWEDPAFSLSLPPEKHQSLPFNLANLESDMRQGVEELEKAVDRKYLGALYAQILADRRPAWLTGLTQPLSPHALAVLLLPLPRDRANAISLAGWIPSSRASVETLKAARWDVVVLPPHLVETVSPQSVDGEEKDQGWKLAEALMELQPQNAKKALEDLAKTLKSRKPRSIAPPAPPPVVVEPPPPPPPEEGPALSPVAALRPGARIFLPEPRPNASDLLKELHDFACRVDRRWPDLDRWSRKPISQLEPIDENLFPSWIARLQQRKPEHIDEEQWTVKLDLLRSAALVLRPTHLSLAENRSKLPRVPVLLFALVLSKSDLLEGMGETTLREALRQSLSPTTCHPSPWTRKLREKLAGLQSSKRKHWVGGLIREALDVTREEAR
jgi:hypothetical protein